MIRLRLGPLQLAALQCHTDVCEDETDCPAVNRALRRAGVELRPPYLSRGRAA